MVEPVAISKGHKPIERTLEFQQATRKVSRETLIDSLEAAREGDALGQLQVAAAMTWTAFCCPDATPAVYDNIVSVWLRDGEPKKLELDASLPEVPLREDFWDTYWAVVNESRAGVLPSRANTRITALGFREAHPEFLRVAERSVQNHPRVGGALVGSPPGGIQPDTLRSCPDGSLGQRLHQMIVGHGYNLALIERRQRFADSLPQSMGRVNAYVSQMHRPWELIAGYDTGDAHQIAYGGFLLAQFGLHQAAMVLASFATIGCFLAPSGFYILLHLISEGWRHGQASPEFMDIDWESEWIHSVETIRKRHGITPFRSVFSKNLFEVFGTPGN